MKKNKKTFAGDDGRVVSKMNVDGMPWYVNTEKKASEDNDFSDLTRGETWAIIKGTLKSSLLVWAVFMVGFLLLILFCVYVWF
jgi:hypothetical protein